MIMLLHFISYLSITTWIIVIIISYPSLRLDFQAMTGYTVSTAAATAGACTASFQATGKSGTNPPAICGTNTDYHSKLSWMVAAQNTHLSYYLTQVYVEFGGDSADSIELKHTLDTAQKSWNILLKQIACTASWKYNL